jgi:hypothetical protein
MMIIITDVTLILMTNLNIAFPRRWSVLPNLYKAVN